MTNIGYENSVNNDKVIAIINVNSAPSKRTIRNARDQMLLIDATEGKKTLSIIITESGHVIASALKVETLRKRFCQNKEKERNIYKK